jgi:D-psicose/D-tagatose/L-ribulose 3-epimerase
MKLCISNIAWDADEDAAIAELLRQFGVQGVEIAPTKIWPNPAGVAGEAVAEYRAFWETRGMPIAALQALLFGHPELTIFRDQATRDQTIDYLGEIAVLGGALGAGVLVFGSPKNRAIGSSAADEVRRIGVDFFRKAGEAACRAGVRIAIEPNPPEYGCDYVRTVEEAVDLVRRVDHPGFGLHMDASAMILNGEDFESAIEGAAGLMAHFHISDPHLAVLGAHPEEHRRIAAALRRTGWTGWVSIEMRGGQTQPNRDGIERALHFACEIYHP